MLVSSTCAFGIHRALVAIGAPYLHLISYIVVIASAVQLVEMFIKRFSPALFRALGIFLPLITTNCAILGVALFQTNREYSYPQSLAFALGAGAGFTLALLLMSGLRERLELSDVSSVVKGAALTLMIAGILSMAFMGFAGMSG
jgi:electron transport complex protein RnfA